MADKATSGQGGLKYYCPEMYCDFNESSGSEKFFKKKLLLDQHVANKHRDKQFKCPVCNKMYAFDWQLRNHQKGCGLIWSCESCDKTYSERLSLLVHCRRHSHKLPNGADFREKFKSRLKKDKSNNKPDPPTVVVLPIFVPVPSPHVQVVRPIRPKVTASYSSISTQTVVDQSHCSNCIKKSNKSIKTKKSTQTQTNQEDKMKGKASTSVQCAPVRCIRTRKKRGDQLTKESAETQTSESMLVTSRELNNEVSNPTLKISVGVDAITQNVDEPLTPRIHQNLFASENIQAISTEMSVQTDEVPVDYQYSTIETQTMSTDQELLSLFDCEDGNDLFLELNMNDIETQTNWNEINYSTNTTDASTCIDEFLKGFNF